MALVPFADLMRAAERDIYAVGYFESWDLGSLMAVADAAEAAHSPVLLGFSGIYLGHPLRLVEEPLAVYAAMSREVAVRLSVPACLVFNECPRLQQVLHAVGQGFGLVMFSDEELTPWEQAERVRAVAHHAHHAGVAVEGEVTPLPGVGGELTSAPEDRRLTSVADAAAFVEATLVDALAVNVGQAHMHGRVEVSLDLARIARLKKAVHVPLVLHGATSVRRDDIREAVRLGIRKINVGSLLKRTYFEALRRASLQAGQDYNPYEVVGSGLGNDVLAAARKAMQGTVEDCMRLFGSAERG